MDLRFYNRFMLFHEVREVLRVDLDTKDRIVETQTDMEGNLACVEDLVNNAVIRYQYSSAGVSYP